MALLLRAAELTVAEFSKPKQTETTRRWKVAVTGPAAPGPVRTKIEFSARGAGDSYRLDPVPSAVVSRYALRAPADAGLALRLRRGLWSLDRDLDPAVLPPYLTAPLPAYVSLFSALARHDMIEQIPGRMSVASLDRARTIVTSLGVYAVHHLAPELFGGFEGSEEAGYLARAEKALFDTVYVRAAAGSRAYFPELSLAADFDDVALAGWTAKIESRRLRTLVTRQLGEVLESSERQSPAAGGAVGSSPSSPRPSRAM